MNRSAPSSKVEEQLSVTELLLNGCAHLTERRRGLGVQPRPSRIPNCETVHDAIKLRIITCCMPKIRIIIIVRHRNESSEQCQRSARISCFVSNPWICALWTCILGKNVTFRNMWMLVGWLVEDGWGHKCLIYVTEVPRMKGCHRQSCTIQSPNHYG